MSAHIAILDIGKTNKKLLVFDEDYQLVFELADQLAETVDEDGFPCEDIAALSLWCKTRIEEILIHPEFNITAIQFSGYGASFVHLDKITHIPTLPLYNYLKPLDRSITDQFYASYGEPNVLALQTCSPSLGMLNSGLQLYRLKHSRAALFATIGAALHLPQYLSFLFTNHPVTEMTSIGCHTMLWNYADHDYHSWVYKENLDHLFPAIHSSTEVFSIKIDQKEINVGIGLHDSSAALIPYLASIQEPFIFLSTGTWCIAMNPFMKDPLTAYQLRQDTLCYISYQGQYVKASRLFLGHEHQVQLDRLCVHFGVNPTYIDSISYDPGYLNYSGLHSDLSHYGSNGLMECGFDKRYLFEIDDFDTAYHVLIHDLVRLQKRSILLVQDQHIKSIYVDGGFAKNKIFMKMLAMAFHELEVYSASASQASGLGAAMSIHGSWNRKEIFPQVIQSTLIIQS